jgi:serine phosphatase RsbU (regulator of sigma subunit)
MSQLRAKSPAFRKALRHSERLRIAILLLSLAFILLLRGIRTFMAPTDENVAAFYLFLLCIALLATLEFFTYRAMNHAHHEGHTLGSSFWLLNVLVECLFPAVIIATVASSSIHPDYRPLANPAFLFYFLLLTLSTLRLNPSLSLSCGFFAAFSYLTAAYVDGWRPGFANVYTSLYSPQKTVITYGMSLIVGGAVAAVVAREFRSQVEAALREAETRREMEHLQHDLDVARNIQQSLLPHSMPQVDGWDIAAWNQPADQTGGDYYDWQPLHNGRIVAALADVTGHGIGPALLAAVCRAYARTNFRTQESFLKSMEELNAAVAADVREGRFITFVAAIIGPESATVELLSAGHGPLFLYLRQQNRFEEMEAQGLPLGISDAFLSDPPHLLEFQSGDILILATDGFFEWANPFGERFGADRMERSIRESRDKSAADLIHDLHQNVLEFSHGTKQMDDLTAIVIKRL